MTLVGRSARLATATALFVAIGALSATTTMAQTPPLEECISEALIHASTGENAFRGTVQLISMSTLAGEFADYTRLTLLVSEPSEHQMVFIVDCRTGEVWDGQDFREPIPPPWNKLGPNLRRIVRSDRLPSEFEAFIFVNIVEPLLKATSVDFPYALDSRIWNSLSPRDREILEDAWKRYENVPGEPVYPTSEHVRVINEAIRLIGEHNAAITWPVMQSLLDKVGSIEGAQLASRHLSPSSHSVLVRLTQDAFARLWSDPDVGLIEIPLYGWVMSEFGEAGGSASELGWKTSAKGFAPPALILASGLLAIISLESLRIDPIRRYTRSRCRS